MLQGQCANFFSQGPNSVYFWLHKLSGLLKVFRASVIAKKAQTVDQSRHGFLVVKLYKNWWPLWQFAVDSLCTKLDLCKYFSNTLVLVRMVCSSVDYCISCYILFLASLSPVQLYSLILTFYTQFPLPLKKKKNGVKFM